MFANRSVDGSGPFADPEHAQLQFRIGHENVLIKSDNSLVLTDPPMFHLFQESRDSSIANSVRLLPECRFSSALLAYIEHYSEIAADLHRVDGLGNCHDATSLALLVQFHPRRSSHSPQPFLLPVLSGKYVFKHDIAAYRDCTGHHNQQPELKIELDFKRCDGGAQQR